MRALLLAGAAALLPGCAVWGDWFDRERSVIVTELAHLPACGEVEPDAPPQVYLFNSAFAVREWQQQHGIPASQIDASIEGPFAIVALGAESAQGNSLLVSREAVLHGGARLVLSSTIYHATRGKAGANPCVLLALPPRHYDQIELFDQERALRATTSAEAVIAKPEPEPEQEPEAEPEPEPEAASPPTNDTEEQGQ